ncbi:hypothetical protein MLD38_004602 [Melastoma candidum]|uniref:Uncharacterized protein n=1 Tax=Melastoma candidum TaxID=119954 RepID=A0ACB9S9H9_9MYRT|nr:hypothetical protein MLD38_004602 [Melastoma candidum]
MSYVDHLVEILYLAFAFCSALFLGALKGVLVGPIASLILILGNVGVILGMFPAHVGWTIYTIIKIDRIDIPIKVAILLGLPALFAIWLGLSLAGSVLVGVGYGFFTPWVSTFEAFRHDNKSNKFYHCLVDGTWGTIKGSCTVVRDFGDLCYHSYPLYLKESRESPASSDVQPLRLVHIPACILVGIMGLVVDIPLFTAIAIAKSPYMLVKGWFRLIHDLISREGPFLETACIPIAGLMILMWPLIVIGSILMAIFSSFFIALYGSVIVYQERSFWRGIAYVVAMVAEFDEYTNDWLYLREGTILPKPKYRKRKSSPSSEYTGGNQSPATKMSNVSGEAPAMLVPSLARSRSVRETLQEVKMVQVGANLIRNCEMRGRELLDANVITAADLYEWLNSKNEGDATVVGIGLPCYSLLHTILHSIKYGSDGLLMLDNIELNYLNMPKDKLLDLFFGPVMVLKEQIRGIKLGEGEAKFLQMVVLFGSNAERILAWDNGGFEPLDALRAAQIRGISRRMIGMIRGVSKLPTYRRRYRHLVKALVRYSVDKESSQSNSGQSGASFDIA